MAEESDVSTSAAVFLGFRVSKKSPTDKYSYGYDKAEDLAGLGVALASGPSAVFAGVESYRKLVGHAHTSHLYLGMAGAVLGIVGNQVVARYRLGVGRRINRNTLIVDAKHSWLDALSSAGALVGLILVAAGYRLGDPVAGLAVTLFIVHVGYEEVVPSLVELGWRSRVNSRRRLRQFRGSRPSCLGERGGGGDELGHLLIALDPAERPFGVEHPRGGPAEHHVAVARSV